MNLMDIEKQFNFIAEEYDSGRKKFISCFDDFYKTATDLIIAHIKEPQRIVDLGAGTGLLTYFWYQYYPNAEYVLVDIADEMLNVARKRFYQLANVTYQIENYLYKLPDGFFDIVISALSIHHLEDEDKKKLFTKIYDRLPSGGLFVNYDQFCAGQSEMDEWFNTYWENQILNSGLSESDIALWRERRKLDKECSVEKEVEMLQQCNFNVVKCVYSYHKFSVIVAIK